MSRRAEVCYRHMSTSPALDAQIEQEVEKLETFCDAIQSCRVTIEQPHLHHRHGRNFHVHIVLCTDGAEVVVGHEVDGRSAYEDAHMAVAAQFESLRGRLQRALSKRRRFAPIPAS